MKPGMIARTALLLLAVLAAHPRAARAQAGPPAPAGTPTSAPAPTSTLTPPEQDTEPWFDASHAALERSLAWTVTRLDRFFADERETDEERPGSFVRWRNDLRLGTDTVASYSTGLRADLDLPALSARLERLRLTIAGDTVEPLDALAPGDTPPGQPGPASAGLRYLVPTFLLARADLSAGLLFRLPLGYFTRLRLRWAVPIGGRVVARLAASGFWQTTTGWGTREDVVLERPIVGHALVRLASFATLTERSRGVEWRSQLAVLRPIGDRAAVAAAGGAEGASDAGPVVEVWRVSVRGRRDVLRRWLFLEVEPELSWPRQPGGGRSRVWAVTFRLEVQFGVSPSHAPRPPPSPPPTPVPAPTPTDPDRGAGPPSGGTLDLPPPPPPPPLPPADRAR
jgi:hypothetical protein